jgi:uncharacterized membrane protein YkvA (DUF1232 family)
MGEVAKFVAHGAARVTPLTVDKLLHQLPLLKVEFAQLHTPKFPHLVDQLEFLADIVEDYAEGVLKDMPYAAIAGAAFALIYAHRQVDLIPDFLGEQGHADDSAITRAVLMAYEHDFTKYAVVNNRDWGQITVKP